MKCTKCGSDNKRTAKFCGECGNALAQPKVSAQAKSSIQPSSLEEHLSEPFWKPDWKWHARSLVIIYVLLTVVYFALSLFLSKVPEPYRMRDIPEKMTPWLKN